MLKLGGCSDTGATREFIVIERVIRDKLLVLMLGLVSRMGEGGGWGVEREGGK